LKSRLKFYFRAFDSASIPLPASACVEPVEFFSAGEDEEASVDSEGEIALMNWLAAQPDFLAVLLAQVGLSGKIVFDTNVVKPFFRSNEVGEVDLVAIPEGAPKSAVAFQVKRFPVRRDGERERVVLNPAKRAKLISQCNDTAALGFHRVYGVVLIVTDGRNHPAVSALHRGASEQTFIQLYRFTRDVSLNSRVGLAFLEIVQPTARDWTAFGMVAAGIDEQADPIEQAGEFSEKVEKWARGATAKGRCASMEFDCSPTTGVPVSAHEQVKAVLNPKHPHIDS